MTGSATFARDADVASVARARLDAAAAAMAAAEDAKRSALAALVELWPTSAWVAAGATSAKRWLLAYTGCSEHEAHRLERLAGLCHRYPALAEAVLGGTLSLSRAERLGAAVNPDREPWLADSLAHLLDLDERGCADEDWSTIVRHWAALVDQERDVRQVPRHSLTMCQRLFGGGEIHADLSPFAFLNVATAIEGWTDDPDPREAPYQRSLGERRADALDDLCHAGLGAGETCWDDGWTDDHGGTDDDDRADLDDLDDDLDDLDDDLDDLDDLDGLGAEDTFDGWTPTDELDEALAGEDLDLTDPRDTLEAIRKRLRRAERCRRRRARRRTRVRSTVRTHVHIDLRTLADLRDLDHLDDLVLRGEGWRLTKEAAERLLCDTALVAVLFDGKGTVVDANDAAETWTTKQRRVIAARDQHCVFPSCTRPPRHCDIHHLEHRGSGGPTRSSNGALLCRFHHRLLHHHGWQLTVDDGHWVAIDAHGTRWTGRPRAPDRPTARTAS